MITEGKGTKCIRNRNEDEGREEKDRRAEEYERGTAYTEENEIREGRKSQAEVAGRRKMRRKKWR